MQYLNKGGKILLEYYGGEDAPNYIDFYLRKIELFVNLVLDHNSNLTNQGEEEKQAYSIEDVKRELATANDAFIALSKKVNAPIAQSNQLEHGATTKLLQLSDLQNTGSEFVIESLLMKCQSLAIQQPT